MAWTTPLQLTLLRTHMTPSTKIWFSNLNLLSHLESVTQGKRTRRVLISPWSRFSQIMSLIPIFQNTEQIYRSAETEFYKTLIFRARLEPSQYPSSTSNNCLSWLLKETPARTMPTNGSVHVPWTNRSWTQCIRPFDSKLGQLSTITRYSLSQSTTWRASQPIPRNSMGLVSSS